VEFFSGDNNNEAIISSLDELFSNDSGIRETQISHINKCQPHIIGADDGEKSIIIL
jgi:hypothetical protein